MSIHNNTTLEAINLQLGQNGFDAIEKIPGGEFHTGKWCAIFNPDDEEITMVAKDKLDQTYMRMAEELAKLSYAERKKVGCH